MMAQTSHQTIQLPAIINNCNRLNGFRRNKCEKSQTIILRAIIWIYNDAIGKAIDLKHGEIEEKIEKNQTGQTNRMYTTIC